MMSVADCLLLCALACGGAPALLAQDQPEVPQAVIKLKGRVVTFDGTPLPGAAYALAKADALVTAQLLAAPPSVTDAQGRFELPVAAPRPDAESQPITLLLALKGRAAVAKPLYLKQKKGSSPEDPVYEAETDLGDLVLPDGARLTGRVRDEQGKPIAGVLVRARDLFEQGQWFPGQDFEFLCTARSDQSGIFSLPCALPQGVVLEIAAAGYLQQTLQPVATSTPLEVTLQKGGFVGGRVLDKDGKGIAGASVVVQYERRGFSEPAKTGADGSFRLNLAYAGRYRITATAARQDGKAKAKPGAKRRQRAYEQTHSEVLAGAKDNLELQFQPPDADKANEERKDEPLPVRAIDKQTRQPVTEFKACSLWEDWANRNPNYLEYRLHWQMQQAQAAEEGKVEVPGPGQGGSGTGAVRVLAKGYALTTVRDVEFKDLEAGKAREPLLVELSKEAVVSGVVQDEVTGAPIAEARVWARPKLDPSQGTYFDQAPGEAPDDAVTTAADGSFRIGQLGEGTFELRVRHSKRPPLPATEVTLQDQEQKTGTVLKLLQGAAVKGRLVGGPIGRGWKVFLHEIPAMQFQNNGGYYRNYNNNGNVLQGAVDLADDGSFAFEGQKLDSFFLVLTIPSAPRCGGNLFVPLEPLRLRKEGLQRDFDVGADRPGEIKGRITLPAAAVPFERLVVVAQAMGEDGQMFWSPYNNSYPGPRSFVDQGGNYRILTGPGRYLLQLVDMGTGIRLHMTDKALELPPNGSLGADLAPRLYQLTVKLAAEDGKKEMAMVDRIEVRVAPKVKGQNGMVLGNDNDQWDSGIGQELPPGATELKIVVPDAQVHLLARNNVMALRLDEQRNENQPLGKSELETSDQPEKNVVTLKVGPPPEIKKPKAKDGEAANADGSEPADPIK